MAFRISVSLSTFFNDQRSLSYILIDNRFKTIEDLEEHIKISFGINNGSEICLISDNHLLPSLEGIDILRPNESINVVPVKPEFYVKKLKKTTLASNEHNNKRTHSISDADNVDFEQKDNLIESFKKSKKVNKNYTDSCENTKILKFNDGDSSINRQFEEPTSNIHNQTDQLTTIESYNCFGQQGRDNKAIKIINIENVGHMEISQAMQNLENSPFGNSNNVENKLNVKPVSEKKLNCFHSAQQNNITANKERKTGNIPFTVGNILSLTNHNFDLEKKSMVNISQSDNDDLLPLSNVPSKKRKRIRTRKPKKKFNLPLLDTMISGSDNDNNIESSYQDMKPPKPIHIRFEVEKDNEKPPMNNENNSEAYNNIETKKVSKTETCITNGYSHRNNKSNIHDLKNILKNLDLTTPELNLKTTVINQDMPPEIGNIFAFKLYEFNDNYEPIISNWVIGKIINYNDSSKDIDFEILAGKVQANVPFGKFNIPEDDNEHEQNDFTQLNYVSLIDPRLVNVL